MKLEKQIYSITEVIQMSGLGRTKLYEEINKGFLKAKKIGARTVVPASAYTEWLNNLPDFIAKSGEKNV